MTSNWTRSARFAFAAVVLLASGLNATAAEKLRFAVGPFQPTPSDTKKAYEPFFKHLADKLGRDFELVVTTDWAGIAVALHEASQPTFRAYAQQVVANARALAAALLDRRELAEARRPVAVDHEFVGFDAAYREQRRLPGEVRDDRSPAARADEIFAAASPLVPRNVTPSRARTTSSTPAPSRPTTPARRSRPRPPTCSTIATTSPSTAR